MTTAEDLQRMEGQTAVDVDGAKLGKIGQIYVDDQSGQPLWVTISTGMFGTRQSFAPLHGSRAAGEDLQLAVTKGMVSGAPGVEADGHIGDDENEALHGYYHEYLGGNGQDQGQDREYAGDSREDLAGRARLRKYVLTENVTQTVPVSHEEVRLESEPVTGADVNTTGTTR